jgi:hypothetical protein
VKIVRLDQCAIDEIKNKDIKLKQNWVWQYNFRKITMLAPQSTTTNHPTTMTTYIPHRVQETEDTRAYYNEKDEEIAWFLTEGGKMTQVQIFLTDEDPQVRNKMLRWNNGTYSNDLLEIDYEKVFLRGNTEIREYYSNDEMWMYTETIDSGNWRFIRYRSDKGTLMSMEIDIQLHTGEFRNMFVMMREETGWQTHKSLAEEGFWNWEEIQ